VLAYLELDGSAAAAGLRQGLFARGTIELQRRSALLVPASALRFDQAQPYVLAVVNGKAVMRVVSVGARGDSLFDGRSEPAIEVTAGLDPGTPVLRGTVGTLREGTLIKLPAAAPSAASASAATASR
jgi:membrane fusion protein, multidrug efflux system